MATRSPVLEICTETLVGVRRALEAGADRIELCSDLERGGVTPSVGLVEEACAFGARVVVLIRPRVGGFVFDECEISAMERDLECVLGRAAVAGFALGALTASGELDVNALRRFSERIDGRAPVTFHRAFDDLLTAGKRDPRRLLDLLAERGVSRVLTAGGRGTAFENREALARLRMDAAERGVTVIAAGGVRSSDVGELVRCTGVEEVHASARIRGSGGSSVGLAAEPVEVDGEEVRRMRTALGR